MVILLAAAAMTGVMLLGVVVIVFTAFVLGAPVMLLWNALMPHVFGLPEVNYIQAVGLYILSALLFKSAGSASSSRSDDRPKHQSSW